MASDDTAFDNDPPPDPFEAELVAYLDGELDEATARKVEARLAKDPVARERADELRKSFAMLDYLPRAEPSPNFTSRTLDQLPTVKPPGAASPRRNAEPTPTAARSTQPNAGGQAGSVSTSMPVPLDSGAPTRNKKPRLLLWVGVFAAVTAFAAVGYGVSAVVYPLFVSREKDPEPPLDVSPRVIDNLHLYALADDITFVAELAKPDYFGEDPAVAYDPTLRVQPFDGAETPNGQQVEALTKTFRSLPPARQAEIVKLEQDIHAKEPKERERLFRVLETYGAWLARLPDTDRRTVLGATSATARLESIRKYRERQWFSSLPAAVRAKPELVQQWKEEEAIRRDRLAFIRQHAEAFAANKSPWPFDTEAGKKEVIEFARTVLRVEDIRRCRLSLTDLGEYRRTLDMANRDDTWAWYGLLVYELSRSHPYLPEPENPKQLITDVNDLPEMYMIRVNPKKGMPFPRPRLNSIGKWPEFPLEVLKEVPLREGPFVKGPIPQLGPARLNEFKQPVRDFANKELFPKMSGDEKRELQQLNGKWPEYPQRLIHYAHKYDLSVPGVMLPGSPKKWEATYAIRPRP